MNRLQLRLIRRVRPRRMRRLRRRLTFLIYLAVIVSSLLTLLLTVLTRNDVIFQRDAEAIRVMLFGFAAKDVVLLLVCVTAVVLTIRLTSRSTTDPVTDLTHAAREIASGNFDVTVGTRGKYISEFSDLQQSFNLMARELRSNEYLRKDFIANVSHELKTPLSIIAGYARLLEDGNLTPAEQSEYVRFIATEAERLTDMTGNMLRLSRIDNHQITPQQACFPLGEQLRQVILQLEPRWNAAELELDIHIPDLDYTGDAELLGQAWYNLLDNAIKFTPNRGQIAVSLAEGETHVTVTVADSGIGMDKETAARVFEQFYQGDTSRRREGSGLGLPLTRRIVELHGGSISVESTPGEGSAFTVTLPKKPKADQFTQSSRR